MKTIFKLIFIFFLFPNFSFVFSQDSGPYEIYVNNLTGHTIYVQLYPVGMVFNGYNMYNLIGKTSSHNIIDQCNHEYDYNGGTYYVRTSPPQYYVPYYRHMVGNNGNPGFNVDLEEGGNCSSLGSFCFGLYKLEIQHSNGNEIYKRDSCIIEYDYYQTGTSAPGDLQITINPDEQMKFRFTYFFDNYPVINIKYTEPKYYKIECWKQNGPDAPATRNKRFGPSISDPDNAFFTYKTETGIYSKYNIYNWIPLDSRRDCNNYIPPFGTYSQNQIFPDQYLNFEDDERQGTLTLNLFIQKDVYTPTATWNGQQTYPAPITIMPDVKFKLAANVKFTMNELPYGMQHFTMLAKTNSKLFIDNSYHIPPTSKIIIFNTNWLVLEPNSEITMNTDPNSNSEIEVHPWGVFCDHGAIKHGTLRVHYVSGGHYINNCAVSEDNIFDDSTSIMLDSGVVMTIPDSTNFIVDGNSSILNISPTSTLKFGRNSKLIIRNGARIKADQVTFMGTDSSSTWDGIYLSDISNDTITNCTIENAINGINIIDKTNAGGTEQPSTEISNCTFSNTTTTQLTNGIYVNNSENILIKGNNFSSSQLTQGFANGVMIEYCPAGSPLVVDNNIDKVLTGMFVSQSSPYVARNIITGVSGSGKGIELDNANGTFKYNIVSNFVNSFITSYSSPYLLKNTFSGASQKNMDIYCSSIPVMRPINSGTTLSWLSGNNYISGSPSDAGISYQEDAYPDIDSGFSIINVGNSYYMSGEIPGSLDGILYAAMNYWTDEPTSQKFNVSGGEVVYDPTFDGSSYPPIDYYDLTELGFGLYDTVIVESLGDNPEADNLFMQAYQSERNHQYLQAIYLYKQVITNYRNSTYAPISLSRIFNCLEKRISTFNEYQLLQTYMSNLRTSNQYNRQIREIAEDYIIKAKVKLGYLRSAINDYQTMYQNNQNNHKGIHALINKEILTAMLNDSGDTPTGGNNYAKLTNHKLRLLSIITGRDFTPLKVTNNSSIPREYKLYQNYPNPFNPKTTIKYDIPKDGLITFSIYDVLGKQLHSKTEYKTAGSYQINLDGTNYASGLYFYRIEAGNFVQTKKMVLIK